MPSAQDRALYEIGIDVQGFERDAEQISQRIQLMGTEATRTFERDFGTRLGKSLDPKNFEDEVRRARNLLTTLGPDAGKAFERSMGREASRKLFQPFLNETQTFVGQLKSTLKSGFDIKSIALGSAAGLGLASLTTSLLNAGKAAIQFSAEFELALAKVRTIAGEDFNITQIADDIKKLSQEVPQDVITLTKGLGDIIGSGIKESSDALNVLEISAKAAVAGLTETATASRGIVFVLNAYGKSAKEASAISDILFKTVDEGVITFEELAANIGDVAGPAAQAQIDFGEVGAAIAFLTKQGISASESVTALRNLITRIIDPAENAKKAAKELGLELSLTGVKAAGGFTKFIQQVKEVTKGDIVQIQRIFPEERAFRAASRLAGEVGAEFQRMSGIFTDTAATAGATEKAFQTINDTADQQFKLLKNNLSVAVLELGGNILNALLPALKALNDAFENKTALEKTIENLRALGVQADKLQFLELRNSSEKSQHELARLDWQLTGLIQKIGVFGITSSRASSATRASVLGARAIVDEFEEVIRTSEGIGIAQQRLVKIANELREVNEKIASNQIGSIKLSRDELNVYLRRRETLNGEQAALTDLYNLAVQYVAQQEKLSAVNKEIETLENKTTQEKVKQVDSAKQLLDLTKSLGVETKNFGFLALEEQQRGVLKSMNDIYEKQVELNKAAREFVASQTSDVGKKVTDELLQQGVTMQTLVAAETQLATIRAQASAILTKRDEDERKGIAVLESRKKFELDSLALLNEQALAVEDTLKFLRDKLGISKEQNQVLTTTKTLTDAQLKQQKKLAEQRQKETEKLKDENLAALDRIAKEYQEQVDKEKKLRDEIDKTNEDLERRLELASTKTDVEAEFVALRQQYQAQIKNLAAVGREREEQEKKINEIARREFAQTLRKFEDGLDDLQKKKLQELLLKLKVTLEGDFNFDEFIRLLQQGLDEALAPSLGQQFQKRLRDIGKPFADFELFLEDFGILLDAEFFDLAGRIDKGFADIFFAATKFGDALAHGSIVGAITGGIELVNRVFGSFGERSEELKRIDEIQRRAAEENKKAAEELRHAFERLAEQLDSMSLKTLDAELRATESAITALIGVTGELTATDLQRVEELSRIVGDLERQIQEAEDLGNLDLAAQLREELAPLADELEAFGFRTSNLTAAQLEQLRTLVEQSDAIRNAINEFGRFGDTFTGVMNKLNVAFDLFDVSDPIQKLALLQQEIRKKFGAELPTTIEGIDEFVQRGFAAFAAGGEDLIDFLRTMNLEELTADEFLELLNVIENFGDELSGETGNISNSLQRLLDELGLVFELSDIEDAARQLAILRTQINREFSALIPSEIPELENFIQDGLRAFLAGGEQLKAFLENFGLEELTGEQFKELLLSFEGLLDSMKDAVNETFQTMMSELNLTFELLNIEDPLEKFKAFSAEIARRFGGLIPSEIPDLERFIEDGLQAFLAGGETLKEYLAGFGLEELTREEFEELLRNFRGLLNEMNSEVERSFPLQRLLDNLGLVFDLGDIEDATARLGILRTQINRELGGLIPSDVPGLERFIQDGLRAFLSGGEQLEAFLAQFGLEELSEDQFEGLLKSFENLLDEMKSAADRAFQDMISDLNLTFDLLNVEDPIERFKAFSKEIEKRFGAILPQTQDELENLLQRGLNALLAGGTELETFLSSINLEELTADQFEAFLRQVRQFADDLKARGDSVTDTEQEIKFSAVKAVTFQQGNKLIDEITSLRIVSTQILAEIRRGVDFQSLLSGLTLQPAFNLNNLAAALSGLNPAFAVPQAPAQPVFILVNGENSQEVTEGAIDVVNKRLLDRGVKVAKARGLL